MIVNHLTELFHPTSLAGESVDPVDAMEGIEKTIRTDEDEFSHGLHVRRPGALAVAPVAEGALEDYVQGGEAERIEEFNWLSAGRVRLPFLEERFRTVVVDGHVGSEDGVVESWSQEPAISTPFVSSSDEQPLSQPRLYDVVGLGILAVLEDLSDALWMVDADADEERTYPRPGHLVVVGIDELAEFSDARLAGVSNVREITEQPVGWSPGNASRGSPLFVEGPERGWDVEPDDQEQQSGHCTRPAPREQQGQHLYLQIHLGAPPTSSERMRTSHCSHILLGKIDRLTTAHDTYGYDDRSPESYLNSCGSVSYTYVSRCHVLDPYKPIPAELRCHF